MKKLDLKTIAGTAVLFSAFPVHSYAETFKSPSRPNIIFVYADDWGWGDMSAHGSKWLKTPNLDRLVAEGSDFYSFNVLNPVSSPSRCGLLTGKYPARYSIHEHFASHKMNIDRGMPDWLDVNCTSLPRQLQKAGYKTAHYGKWHLAGLGSYEVCPHPKEYGYDDYAGWNGPKPGANQHMVFGMAVDFVYKSNKEGKPAFVNLWLKQTHTPHTPSAESMKKYGHLPEQKQVYAAVVEDGDRGIGIILDKLKELGIDDNTIVIFSSDNGPEVTGGENMKMMKGGKGTYYSVGETGGYKGRKRSLYEGGVRTPFIVRWPGVVKAGYVDKNSLITAVDVFPTLCEIAGAEVPAGLDGESRLSVIKGTPAEHRKPVFWEWKGSKVGPNWARLAIQKDGWKLLTNGQRTELYDMKKDSKQNRNMASQKPEMVKALLKELNEWKATLPEKADPACINRNL